MYRKSPKVVRMAVSSSKVVTTHPRSTGIDFPEIKRKNEKEEAIAHLQELHIPEILEELLNKACKVKPDDVFGYMSEHFHALSKEPLISSLSAREGLDNNSRNSVQVDLYCTICGTDKLITRTSLSVEPYITAHDTVPSSPRRGSGKKLKASSRGGSPVTSASRLAEPAPVLGLSTERKVNAVDTVNTEISKALKGLPVRKQYDVDHTLEALRIKAVADKVILEPSSMLAVSCAVAQAGSQLSSHPLFLYLSPFRAPSSPTEGGRASLPPYSLTVDMFQDDKKKKGTRNSGSSTRVHSRSMGLSLPVLPPSHPPQKYSMPVPVVAMIGQSTGKAKVREFCVCPRPGAPMLQQMKMLGRLHYELGKVLAAKLGAGSRATVPNGAYSASIDKLDQGLDLLKEAATNAGFQFNVDMAVLIDMGAGAVYDEDKGKYEFMSGPSKTTDEVITMYSDLLLHANNGVLGLIDPLHPKDVAGWKKLINKLSSKCLIMADNALKKGLRLVVSSKELSDDGAIKVEGEVKVEAEPPKGEESGGGIENICCAALTWENTLSSTMDKIDHLKDCSLYVMLTAPPNITMNTTMLADLAVACRCKFMRLGAPVGMTTVLLNRLLHINEELISRNILETDQDRLFASNCQQ